MRKAGTWWRRRGREAREDRGDWGSLSNYERWYASTLGQAYLRSLQDVLAPWLRALAGRAARAIDIGCGPGIATEGLFPRGTSIGGIDCSLDMARRAAARSRASGEERRIAVGSVEELPFPGGSFDLAVCVNCLEFVERRARAFGEIARVLRPGGTAVVGVLDRRSLWEITRRLRRPWSGRPYYRGRFFLEEELRGLLEGSGLAVEETRSAVRFPPVPSVLPQPFYEAWGWLQGRLFPRSGAVLLSRARKPAAG